MRHWISVLFVFVGVSTLWAEPFDRAEVTKTINLVSLLPPDRRAAPGDLVKGDTALKTGGNSRAELQFPDLTIARVGSNALFRFVTGTREMVLDSGTMLFSSPKGAGGGKVQAGAITAAVTGSDFLISNAGRVKVICLSHKLLVYFTANPKVRAVLLPGQMLDIVPGTEKKMPPVVTINLETLLATSKLGEAGGFGPFPNQSILAYNVRRQAGFVPADGPLPANDPVPPNGPVPANVSLAAQSAQTVRSTTAANNNPPPSQFAAQPAQPAGSTTAVNNIPPSQSTAAPTAGGSPNTTGSGSGGNRGNNSNIRNIENRGNSGNRGNNSNIRNIENRGNSGNAPGRAGR